MFGDGSARKTRDRDRRADDSGNWTCEVVVQNTGVIHVPVDIELKFADGSSKQLRWDDRGTGNWERFVVERSSKLDRGVARSGGQDRARQPDHAPLPARRRRRAALRAAAWFGWFTQTVMQIVGP